MDLQKSNSEHSLPSRIKLLDFRKPDDNFAYLPRRRGRVLTSILFGDTKRKPGPAKSNDKLPWASSVVTVKKNIYPVPEPILNLDASKRLLLISDGDVTSGENKSIVFPTNILDAFMRFFFRKREDKIKLRTGLKNKAHTL